MNRKSMISLLIVLITAPLYAESWVETFESGVGRLSQVQGNGETSFAYDADNQAIDATYFRHHHSNPNFLERRFAELEDGPIDISNHVIQFAAVVTPMSVTSGANVPAAIGLINSQGVGTALVLFNKNSQTIFPQFGGSSFDPVEGIAYSYGETYFVAAVFDGPNRLFSIDVYRGNDAAGEWLGEINRQVVDEPMSVDAFGLTNGGTASSPSEFHALIHYLSFDLPECVQPAFEAGTSGSAIDTGIFDGYIDPRAESDNGVELNLGLERITLRFSSRMENDDGSPLSVDRFSLTDTANTPPTITDIETEDAQIVTINLDRPLTVQTWTTIGVSGVRSTCGEASFDGHLSVGFLPGDVNQDGIVTPTDLFRFRQIVSGQFVPTNGAIEDYVDTNREAGVTPFDLFTFRQLVNGVSPPATRTWAGQSIANPKP